uniref:Type II toxin-antitoxin system HicA family toxin n=1 Tax=Bursaphelenchus xylophilus TaxID=6326 RepID=A0A1I7SHP8_BURXY
MTVDRGFDAKTKRHPIVFVSKDILERFGIMDRVSSSGVIASSSASEDLNMEKLSLSPQNNNGYRKNKKVSGVFK